MLGIAHAYATLSTLALSLRQFLPSSADEP